MCVMTGRTGREPFALSALIRREGCMPKRHCVTVRTGCSGYSTQPFNVRHFSHLSRLSCHVVVYPVTSSNWTCCFGGKFIRKKKKKGINCSTHKDTAWRGGKEMWNIIVQWTEFQNREVQGQLNFQKWIKHLWYNNTNHSCCSPDLNHHSTTFKSERYRGKFSFHLFASLILWWKS